MGLDMYLRAGKYLTGKYNTSESEKETFNAILEAVNGQDFVRPDLPGLTVEVTVGYWRKANQIHQWFVDNVQDGEDNCANYYVSRDQLEELLTTCKEVQATRSEKLADELLPPQEGFFFGNYEIGEAYFEDIDYTVELLQRVLANVPEDWDFQYQSSW